jgi:hypothetical protein
MKPNDRFESLGNAQPIGSQWAPRHEIQERLIRPFDLRGGRIRQAANRFTQHGSDVGIGLLSQSRNQISGRFIK